MTFLPFETFVIQTSLTKDETIRRLMLNIEPVKTIRLLNSNAKLFEGTFKWDTFEVKPIGVYRKSYWPGIEGKVHTEGDATRVTVTLSLSEFVRIMLVVWSVIAVLGMVAAILQPDSDFKTILAALAVPFLSYGLCMGAWWLEASRLKKLLSDITQGKVIKA